MKMTLIALGLLVVAVLCMVVGCRLLSRRDTSATIAFTAKPHGKVAIVYYSQSQVKNTALLALWIQKHAGGDLIPLELVTPYPDAYGEILKIAGAEFKNGTRPALQTIPDLSSYDIVFVGSPIWFGTYAPPFATFADAVRLDGKTVVPFCTHGGGGSGRFFEDVRKAFPAAKILNGLSLRGSNQIERRLGAGVTVHHTEDDVVAWLNVIFRSAESGLTAND